MKQRDGLAPAAWLNGQTIAIVSTVLTVGVGIGAMVFSSTSSIRGEVASLRGEVASIRGEVSGLRSEGASLRTEVHGLAAKLEDTRKSLSAEIKAARSELSDDIKGLDARLRTVEQDVAVIKARLLPVSHPVTHDASPLAREDDADT